MPKQFLLYRPNLQPHSQRLRLVHVKRNPAATCWSNYKHYFSTKELGYSYDLLDVVHYYQMYQKLMLVLGYERYPGRKFINLDYEQLTTDQESETKKLIQYLGIDWENACLISRKKQALREDSLERCRFEKKVYKGSSEEWKKFEKYLDRAFDDLPS